MRAAVARRGAAGNGQTNLLVLAAIVLVLLAGRSATQPDDAAPAKPRTPAAVGKVVAPVAGARLSSGFGARWGTTHYGLDFAAPVGAPIRAVADGTVTVARPATGFGLWMHVRHRDGTVSVYGHMNTMDRRVGDRVKAGDRIATVGQRGQSTGPHLHLEIWPDGRRDKRIDPKPWFAKHRARLT